MFFKHTFAPCIRHVFNFHHPATQLFGKQRKVNHCTIGRRRGTHRGYRGYLRTDTGLDLTSTVQGNHFLVTAGFRVQYTTVYLEHQIAFIHHIDLYRSISIHIDPYRLLQWAALGWWLWSRVTWTSRGICRRVWMAAASDWCSCPASDAGRRPGSSALPWAHRSHRFHRFQVDCQRWPCSWLRRPLNPLMKQMR